MLSVHSLQSLVVSAIDRIRINILECSLTARTRSLIVPKQKGTAHGLSVKHSDSKCTEATLRKVVNDVKQKANPTAIGTLPF